MRQFITGGAGFIGSNYARYVLNNTDDEVVVYDALTYAGNMSTIADMIDNPRFTFVHGNICDTQLVIDSLKPTDKIVNFAAESHVDRSISNPDVFIDTNCIGTNSIMRAAQHMEVQRIIHIGTDEVYGSVLVGSSLETDPLEPRSPYSASKASSDLIALSYFHTYGMPVMVTRCTNNFGPYQFPEKAIPLFVTNLMDDKQIPLYGDGLHERDWLYVEDHCAAIHTVMQHGQDGEIYNIGAGNGTKNIDLVMLILKKMGKSAYSVQHCQDRQGHDRRYSVNTEKIQALGWSRTRSLEEALEQTIAWYKANRAWWEPLKEAGCPPF